MRMASKSSPDMPASTTGPSSRSQHSQSPDPDISPPDSPVEAVDATTGKSLPIVAIPPRPLAAPARVRTRVFTSPLKFLQPNFPTTNQSDETSNASSRIMSVPIITVGKNERRLPSWSSNQQGSSGGSAAVPPGPIGGTLNVNRRRPSAAMKLRDISMTSPDSPNSNFSPEISTSPTFSTPKTRQTSGIYSFQSPLTCRSTLDVSTTADDDDPIYLTRPHSSYHSSPRPVSFLSFEYAGDQDPKGKSDDNRDTGAPFGSFRSKSSTNKPRLPSMGVDDSGIAAVGPGNSPFDEETDTITPLKPSPGIGGINAEAREEPNGSAIDEGLDSFPSIRSTRRNDVILEEDEENEEETAPSKSRKSKGIGLGLNTQEINDNYAHMMAQKAVKAEAVDEAHTPEHDLHVPLEPNLMNGSVRFRRQDDKESNSRLSLSSLSAPKIQPQKNNEAPRRSITSFNGIPPNVNTEARSKSPNKTDITDNKNNVSEPAKDKDGEARDAPTPEQLPQEFLANNLNVGKVRYRANGDELEGMNKKADRRSITSMGGLRNASVIVKQKRNESGLIPTPSPEQLAIPKRVSECGDSHLHQQQQRRSRTDDGDNTAIVPQQPVSASPFEFHETKAREKAMERLDSQLPKRDNKADLDYWNDDGRKANSMRTPKTTSRPSTARSKSESIARPSSKKTISEPEVNLTPGPDARMSTPGGKRERQPQQQQQQQQQEGIQHQHQQQPPQQQPRKKSFVFSLSKAIRRLLGKRPATSESQRSPSVEPQHANNTTGPPVPPKDPARLSQSRSRSQSQVKSPSDLGNQVQPRCRTPGDRPQSKRLSQLEVPGQQQQQQAQRATISGRPERLSQAASTPRTPVMTEQQQQPGFAGNENTSPPGKSSTRAPRSRRNSRPLQFGNLNTLL